MKDVAVVAYCRTGIAKAQRGALNQTHGIPMMAHVLRNAVKRAGIEATEVEDVVVGCGLPEGATGHNVARNAALEAGFGDAVPGMTVNRYCGSGLSAASIVANRIAAGEAAIAIAGGVESISLVQFSLNLNGFFYPPLQQRMPAVWWTMNQTADFVAKKYGITREAQDAYVVKSQQRVATAAAAGKFAEEIVPFTTTMKVTDKVTKASHEQEVTLARDEGPRPDTTLAGLAKLPPVFPGGTTTAGNASQLSDGAGAVVMMDAELAARRGLPILGLFRGMQLAAVAPDEMSIAIAPAIRKLVKHHGLPMADIVQGAPRGLRGDHALQPSAARDAVGDYEREWRRGGPRPSVRHVRDPLPRLDAARARTPRSPSRYRGRVHGRRYGDCGLPRAPLRRRNHRHSFGQRDELDGIPGHVRKGAVLPPFLRSFDALLGARYEVPPDVALAQGLTSQEHHP